MSVLRKAISTTQAVVVIVIIVAAAVIGVAYTQLTPQPSQPSATLTTGAGTSKVVDTLSIDDWVWPIDDLNVLYNAWAEVPWPNPMSFAVYQPLVQTNLTAEYKEGNIQFLPGLATSWTAPQMVKLTRSI